jgi:archaemetzincin
MEIEIRPFGEIEGVLLHNLSHRLNQILSCNIHINKPLPIPKQAYDNVRKQYLADRFIEFLAGLKSDIAYILGITDVDLFTPGLNFVFGEASFSYGVAIISTFLLSNCDKPSDHILLLDRVTKEAVHEIGHLLGLSHCSNSLCVMHFSNSLMDTDFKQYFFCNNCQPRLIV